MSRLEDLTPHAAVNGVLPDSLVTVVSVQWFGSEALELTYKTPAGKVANELLYRHDEPRIEVVEQGRPWSFDGDGHLFYLVSEANRIQFAHRHCQLDVEQIGSVSDEWMTHLPLQTHVTSRQTPKACVRKSR